MNGWKPIVDCRLSNRQSNTDYNLYGQWRLKIEDSMNPTGKWLILWWCWCWCWCKLWITNKILKNMLLQSIRLIHGYLNNNNKSCIRRKSIPWQRINAWIEIFVSLLTMILGYWSLWIYIIHWNGNVTGWMHSNDSS